MAECDRSHTRPASASLLVRLARDQKGVSAIEYAVLLVLVSMSGLSALGGVGDQLQETFNTSSVTLAGGGTSPSSSGTAPATTQSPAPTRTHHDEH